MREKPILFSGEMVRAILAGSKTQTRRVVRGPVAFVGGRGSEGDLSCWGWSIEDDYGERWAVLERGLDERYAHGCVSIPCPYGVAGDKLWVREAFHSTSDRTHYRADAEWPECGCAIGGWRPSIFMPRWASRITLEITDVRVQRLQEISGEDAVREGFFDGTVSHGVANGLLSLSSELGRFRLAWDSINGKRAPWASNPWVWALSFARVM